VKNARAIWISLLKGRLTTSDIFLQTRFLDRPDGCLKKTQEKPWLCKPSLQNKNSPPLKHYSMKDDAF
jgi:hypothetical protein